MANIKSSKKDMRRIARRTARNVRERSKLKTLRKQALFGTQEEQAAAGPRYAAALDKAAKRNLIHPNKANRQKSAIARRANTAKASA